MLVFGRMKDEGFRIGLDIQVTVIDIRGDKVRLGIEVPKDIPVHRDEIYVHFRREYDALVKGRKLPPEELAKGILRGSLSEIEYWKAVDDAKVGA